MDRCGYILDDEALSEGVVMIACLAEFGRRVGLLPVFGCGGGYVAPDYGNLFDGAVFIQEIGSKEAGPAG